MTIDQGAGSRSAVGSDTGWRDHANCRSAHPDLFFPACGTTGVAPKLIEAAKAVCHACQVRDDCLQFALETKQEAGIWGGTTEDERRRLRRAWLAARRSSPPGRGDRVSPGSTRAIHVKGLPAEAR